MFEWLQNWLSGPRTDFYKPRERLIYRYFNGKKTVKADPLVLFRKIMEVGPELDIDLRVSRSLSQDAPSAYDKALVKIRKIFQLQTFAEGGLGDVEALDLFNHYWVFVEAQKKSGAISPTPATATSAPSASSSDASPVTTNSSASGSVANGSFTEPQAPSPAEPGSPWATSTPGSTTSGL